MKIGYRTYDVPSDDSQFWPVVVSLLDSGNRVRFSPSGSSMSPFIRDGETVVAEPCHTPGLGVGDIILYAASGGSLTSMRVHRILKKVKRNGRTVFLTRGDALPGMDSPVYGEQVLGKISSVEKRGWTLHLDKPAGNMVNLLWTLLHRTPASHRLRLALQNKNRGRCFLR